MKRLLFSLLLAAGFATSVSAQVKIKRYDAIVKVNHTRYKGLLELVDAKGLTINFHNKAKYIAADSIESIRIKKYNAQNRSLLIGGLVGLAGGLTVYKLERDKGNVAPIILPVVIVSSAVAGAAIVGIVNSVTSVEKFEQVNSPGEFNKIRARLKQYALNR